MWFLTIKLGIRNTQVLCMPAHVARTQCHVAGTGADGKVQLHITKKLITSLGWSVNVQAQYMSCREADVPKQPARKCLGLAIGASYMDAWQTVAMLLQV